MRRLVLLLALAAGCGSAAPARTGGAAATPAAQPAARIALFDTGILLDTAGWARTPEQEDDYESWDHATDGITMLTVQLPGQGPATVERVRAFQTEHFASRGGELLSIAAVDTDAGDAVALLGRYPDPDEGSVVYAGILVVDDLAAPTGVALLSVAGTVEQGEAPGGARALVEKHLAATRARLSR